jgi:hypothetical protein
MSESLVDLCTSAHQVELPPHQGSSVARLLAPMPAKLCHRQCRGPCPPNNVGLQVPSRVDEKYNVLGACSRVS